jgi:class 3 adenylate cyclase
MRMAGPLGGRRTVTSLFADVAGSTSIAERLDAEDWTSIMNEAFDVMAQAIYHYEGTVARLLGDGLLAFFGAPVAHEDDHERAIRAGLDMVRDVAIFADRVRSSVGVDFRIRGESTQDPLWWGT